MEFNGELCNLVSLSMKMFNEEDTKKRESLERQFLDEIIDKREKSEEVSETLDMVTTVFDECGYEQEAGVLKSMGGKPIEKYRESASRGYKIGLEASVSDDPKAKFKEGIKKYLDEIGWEGTDTFKTDYENYKETMARVTTGGSIFENKICDILKKAHDSEVNTETASELCTNMVFALLERP